MSTPSKPRSARVEPAETCRTNVKTKLEESFKAGDGARGETKRVAANAKSIATKAFIAFFSLITVFSFIPNQLEVMGQEENSAAAARAARGTAQPQGVAKASREFGVVQTLTAPEGSLSEPIRVTGDRCIRWWDVDPAGNAFSAQVRGIKSDDQWYDWTEWKKLKAKNNFGWIRFQGNKQGAVVSYSFHAQRECKKAL